MAQRLPNDSSHPPLKLPQLQAGFRCPLYCPSLCVRKGGNQDVWARSGRHSARLLFTCAAFDCHFLLLCRVQLQWGSVSIQIYMRCRSSCTVAQRPTCEPQTLPAFSPDVDTAQR